MSTLYITKIKTAEQSAFNARLNKMALKFKADPNWFMQVFYSESKVNPQAVNKQTGATGLIQFMPSTAKDLGTTTAQLFNMNATQQLDFVEKYFEKILTAKYGKGNITGKLQSYFDTYLVVFFPAAIGKPDSYVFETKTLNAAIIARQNPAINIIKDAKITMAEFKQYIVNTVPKSIRSIVFKTAAAGSAAALLLIGVFF